MSANDEMKVEHKKKERIKQIAADRRTAQKFFLIQVDCLTQGSSSDSITVVIWTLSSNLTKITTNTETTMLSRLSGHKS